MKINKTADGIEVILEENEFYGRVSQQIAKENPGVSISFNAMHRELMKLGISPETIISATGASPQVVEKFFETGALPSSPDEMQAGSQEENMKQFARLANITRTLGIMMFQMITDNDGLIYYYLYAGPDSLITGYKFTLETIAIYADIDPEKLRAYAPPERDKRNNDSLTADEKLTLALTVTMLHTTVNTEKWRTQPKITINSQ